MGPVGGERTALLVDLILVRDGPENARRVVVVRDPRAGHQTDNSSPPLCLARHVPNSLHALSAKRRRSSDGSNRRARALAVTVDALSRTKMRLGSRAIHTELLLRKAWSRV